MKEERKNAIEENCEDCFIIYKYKGKFHIIDEFDSDIDIQKGGKLYLIRSDEVVDDWFCDIGAITHIENSRTYLGKVVCSFRRSHFKEAEAKYFELTGEKISLDFKKHDPIEDLLLRNKENEVS